MANTSNLTFRTPPFPTNNIIRMGDQIWVGNANQELAITTANIWHSNIQSDNIYVELVNIVNTSNNELDYEPINIGDTIYTQDSPLAEFEFQTNDWILYLRPPKDQNGKSILNTCHGFQPGDLVCQNIPAEYVSIVLTEEEYRESKDCNVCGCLSCECPIEITLEERTVEIEISPARTVNAIAVHESCDPPYLLVTKASGRFVNLPGATVSLCDCIPLPGTTETKYTCDECGCLGCACKETTSLVYKSSTYEYYGTPQYCITAEIVGVFAPILDPAVFLGPYVITEPGLYKDDCYDWCVPPEAGANCVNFGQYIGGHIGIDKHFTNNRSQDYNDEYIVVANWDITGNNVPIGHCLDLWDNTSVTYTSLGMNVETIAYDSNSSLMLLTTFDNNVSTRANSIIRVDAGGALSIKTYEEESSDLRLFSVENNCSPIFIVNENCTYSFVHTDFNGTVFNEQYADGIKSIIVTSNSALSINVSEAHTFVVQPANSNYNNIYAINLIKPANTKNIAYSCTVEFINIVDIKDNAWNTTVSSVQWPGGTPGSDRVISGTQVLHFLNVDSSNTAQNKTWYGFNPHTTWPSTGLISLEDTAPVIAITNTSPTVEFCFSEVEFFRTEWPVRPFYLLVPTDVGAANTDTSRVNIPDNILNDENFYGPIRINKDLGDSNNVSDWYEICNLASLPYGTQIGVKWREHNRIVSIFENWEEDGLAGFNMTKSLELFAERIKENGLTVFWMYYAGEQRSYINTLNYYFQASRNEPRPTSSGPNNFGGLFRIYR